MCFAFSSSFFWPGSRFLPARLINIWTILIPEPIPLGLTFLLAIVLATFSAFFLNVSEGGNVDSVLILRDHLRLFFVAGIGGSSLSRSLALLQARAPQLLRPQSRAQFVH